MSTPLVIDDTFLEQLRRGRVRIRGVLYVVDDTPGFAIGNVVLDRQDGSHAVIDVIIGDRCAIKDGVVSEANIPLSRLVKLQLQITDG